MKIFLSFPLRNGDLNVREKIVKMLENEGHEVINKELKDVSNCDEREKAKMLGQSIMLMSTADKVIFVSQWFNSFGCSIEKDVCKLYDIPFGYIDDSIFGGAICDL